ncbi:MAG: tetratricopeptide repeat protein [Candidatus Helarchaeota archaeon]
MDKLNKLEQELRNTTSKISLPQTISSDINFKIENSLKDLLFGLIKKRYEILLQLPKNTKLDLDFEFNLIKILFYGKELEFAIKYLEILDKFFPYNYLLFYNRAYILSKVGNIQESINLYRKTLIINPNSAQTYNEIGLLLRMIGKFETAIKVLIIATKIDPKHAESWRNLGILYMENKNFDKAIECLKKALTINQKYITALNFLALCYHYLGDNKLAIKILKKALKINPKFIMGWKNLGAIYNNIGSYERAIESYKKIIDIDNSNVEIRIRIASIYLNQPENLIEAYKILEDVKKIDKNNANLWYHMGLYFRKSGDQLKAEKCFNKAIEIDPDYIEKIPDFL